MYLLCLVPDGHTMSQLPSPPLSDGLNWRAGQSELWWLWFALVHISNLILIRAERCEVTWRLSDVSALSSLQGEELYFSSCKWWWLSQVILSYKSFRFHEKCYNTRSWPSETPESASYFMRAGSCFANINQHQHNICVGLTVQASGVYSTLLVWERSPGLK